MCNKINNTMFKNSLSIIHHFYAYFIFLHHTWKKYPWFKIIERKEQHIFFDNAKADDQAHIYYLGSL